MKVFPRKLEFTNDEKRCNFFIKNGSPSQNRLLLYKIRRSEPKVISFDPKCGIVEPGLTVSIQLNIDIPNITSARIVVKFVSLHRKKICKKFEECWDMGANSGIVSKVIDIKNKDFDLTTDIDSVSAGSNEFPDEENRESINHTFQIGNEEDIPAEVKAHVSAVCDNNTTIQATIQKNNTAEMFSGNHIISSNSKSVQNISNNMDEQYGATDLISNHFSMLQNTKNSYQRVSDVNNTHSDSKYGDDNDTFFGSVSDASFMINNIDSYSQNTNFHISQATITDKSFKGAASVLRGSASLAARNQPLCMSNVESSDRTGVTTRPRQNARHGEIEKDRSTNHENAIRSITLNTAPVMEDVEAVERICWKVSKVCCLPHVRSDGASLYSIQISGPEATDMIIEKTLMLRIRAMHSANKLVSTLEIHSCPLYSDLKLVSDNISDSSSWKDESPLMEIHRQEEAGYWRKSIQQLVITSTLLKEIHCQMTLNKFPSLLFLNLSNNYIEALEGDLVLPNLITLDISGNALTTLHHLQLLSSLRCLDASNNRLDSLSKSISCLLPISKQIKSLNLSNNKVCVDIKYAETISQVFPNISVLDSVESAVMRGGSYSNKKILSSHSKFSMFESFEKSFSNKFNQKFSTTPTRPSTTQALGGDADCPLSIIAPNLRSPKEKKDKINEFNADLRVSNLSSSARSPSPDFRTSLESREWRLQRAFTRSQKSSTRHSINESPFQLPVSESPQPTRSTPVRRKSFDSSLVASRSNSSPTYLLPTQSSVRRYESPRETRPVFQLRSDEWHPSYYKTLRNSPMLPHYNPDEMAACNRPIHIDEKKLTRNNSWAFKLQGNNNLHLSNEFNRGSGYKARHISSSPSGTIQSKFIEHFHNDFDKNDEDFLNKNAISNDDKNDSNLEEIHSIAANSTGYLPYSNTDQHMIPSRRLHGQREFDSRMASQIPSLRVEGNMHVARQVKKTVPLDLPSRDNRYDSIQSNDTSTFMGGDDVILHSREFDIDTDSRKFRATLPQPSSAFNKSPLKDKKALTDVDEIQLNAPSLKASSFSVEERAIQDIPKKDIEYQARNDSNTDFQDLQYQKQQSVGYARIDRTNQTYYETNVSNTNANDEDVTAKYTHESNSHVVNNVRYSVPQQLQVDISRIDNEDVIGDEGSVEEEEALEAYLSWLNNQQIMNAPER